MTDLVAELVAIRKRKGISQREVCRRMGASSATVSQLERGIHSPTLATITRYAAAIGARITVEDNT